MFINPNGYKWKKQSVILSAKIKYTHFNCCFYLSAENKIVNQNMDTQNLSLLKEEKESHLKVKP